ncbi:uncharacterized protein LOC131155747 [Malania oleifera]|uniref:uncharacterized protein LOC131155747 n=1 Tax=Malania oleifera TaxID=397392 RepID=UPI0025AE597E|nr:uncharacterized protein LOC131155747 [Malania oleifera]
MLSGRILTGVATSSSSPSPVHPLFPHRLLKSAADLKLASCSLRLRVFSVKHLELHSLSSKIPEQGNERPPPTNQGLGLENGDGGGDDVEKGDEGEEEISGVQVPRERYISVSKSELLDAIILMMFESQEDIDQFLLLSSCLDSILHAEHKGLLEEMRIDYSITHSFEEDGTIDQGSTGLERKFVIDWKESNSTRDDAAGTRSMERYGEEKTEVDQLTPFSYGIDLRSLFGSAKNPKKNSGGDSRVAVSTRFQRAFLQLLHNAQFEELSASDLMLTSALNTDYLLTLPIYVDWKRASESNAIIFRRGYATERQKGLLIVEKLDYIQSKILERIFSIAIKPLVKVLKAAFKTKEVEMWTKRMKSWLKELTRYQQAYSYNDQTCNNKLDVDQLSENDLPIWLAAQRTVTRYEGILSAVGPRGRLLRKFLIWIGLLPSALETSFKLSTSSSSSEPYLSPIFLPRISLSDIWRPATRKYSGNNIWKMLKTSISVLLSQSVLQEPAFQELILLYTEEAAKQEIRDKADIPSLQLKIYERIPIPDLRVIFPHKKLSFRIIDTVRLDVATILGLLAFFVNYKFEDILASPSAVLLDVIAVSALVLYATRVFLGYKQTWDRYQLLVNRTLYEKTLASGFGSVHFLLDASEQQQYKEAILAYAVLLNMDKGQAASHQSIGDKCEIFMYNVFKKKVEMPINEAMGTLTRLGLVTESHIDGQIRVQAIPSPEAYEALKQRWNSLLN